MKHPNHDLHFNVTRRQFWRALLQEVSVTFDSLQGRPGYALSDLGSLSDHQLARVKPIMHPDCESFIRQGYVWSWCKQTEVTLKLFPTDQENLVAFRMFDGQHELSEIGEHLAREMGWDPARGFALAKELFLSLVGCLVCIPKDPLDLTAQDGAHIDR
jgi:hypothetical protein